MSGRGMCRLRGRCVTWCVKVDDSVILPPGAVMTGNHEMYKVFTPFKNAWLKRLREGMPGASLHQKFVVADR